MENIKELGLHYGGPEQIGNTFFEITSKLHSATSHRSCTFSVLKPLPDLVLTLNDHKPTILFNYLTALELQRLFAGRKNDDLLDLIVYAYNISNLIDFHAKFRLHNEKKIKRRRCYDRRSGFR